jgi:hypothetical protein
MATWPSGTKASTTNLDSGGDSPASARADLKTNVDNVNSVIDMFNIVTPANNQILKYNSSTNVFDLASNVDLTAPGAIGGSTASAGTFTTLTVNAANDLRLADTDSSNYVGFKAPATVTTNKIWTLPSADGTAGQVLSTDGSATLSWATAGGGGASAVGSIQYFTNRGTGGSGVANGSYTNFDQIFSGSETLVDRVNDATFTFKNTGTYYVDMSIFHGTASGSGVSCVLRNGSTSVNEPFSTGEFGSFPTSDFSAPYGSLSLSRHVYMRILTVTSTSHQYGFRVANTSGTTRDYTINGLIFKIQRLS